MAKSKQRKKERPFHLEPYEIREWFELCGLAAAGEIKKGPNLVWAETKNGTLWPHKVVRE